MTTPMQERLIARVTLGMGKGALSLALASLFALSGCGGEGAAPADGANPEAAAPADGESISVAYVTNGIDPFWDLAAVGVRTAAAEFNVTAEVLMPTGGAADQKRIVETLLARGVSGVALSPIDAENQVGFINQACKATNLITHDSDAPESDRLCFIGMDNYKAGREAGKLVKEAIPDGGKVMIFVGRLEQLNSQQRRQGVIDELIDAPMQDSAKLTLSPNTGEIAGAKYTIVGTLTDDFNYGKAKSNAEDTIASHPDLACMVGLFAYNIPNCLLAVTGANKLNQIKLVSFDEQDDTLAGIEAGTVHGTVSQQPYQYGYESIRVLAALSRGDKSVIPENKVIEIPSVIVRKENVAEFRTNLNALKAQTAGA